MYGSAQCGIYMLLHLVYISCVVIVEKPKATRKQQKDHGNRQKKVRGKVKANVACKNIASAHYMHWLDAIVRDLTKMNILFNMAIVIQ